MTDFGIGVVAFVIYIVLLQVVTLFLCAVADFELYALRFLCFFLKKRRLG